MREPWERGWTEGALRRAFLLSAGVHAVLLTGILLFPPRSRQVTWSGSGTGISLMAVSGPPGGAAGVGPRVTAPPAEREAPKPMARPAVKPAAKKPVAKPTPARAGPAQPVPAADPPAAEAGGATGSGSGPGSGPGGGASGSGGSGPLTLMAQADGGAFVYDYYLQTVAEMISRAWEPPAGLIERAGETSAVLRFRILSNGRVSVAEVESASALEVFDRSARAAILRAQPFPPLPATYGGRWLIIHLKFAYGASAS